MSQRNLLKKLLDDFQSKGIQEFFSEYFYKILMAIGAFCLAIVLFVVLVVLIGVVFRPKEKAKNDVDPNPYTVQVTEKIRTLLNDEFVYPKVESADITADYLDLAPLKKAKIPDFTHVVSDYQILEEDTINKTYQFDFEKPGRH